MLPVALCEGLDVSTFAHPSRVICCLTLYTRLEMQAWPSLRTLKPRGSGNLLNQLLTLVSQDVTV